MTLKGFSFAILHWSENKGCFINIFIRLYRGNANTFAPSFKNVEDIPSKPGAFDVFRQTKFFLIVSSVALQSYDCFSLYPCNTALSHYC